MVNSAQLTYHVLSSLFLTSLIVSNLIFQKFFSLNFFNIMTFELSVGIIFYPVTFLVTDVVSEVYGAKKANQMVLTGLFASAFCLLIIYLANVLSATEWSPVDNNTFNLVFGNTSLAVGASMAAYLGAQFIDIKIYHYWKRLTKGRHLWLRNNCSTMFSQCVDTILILVLLCAGNVIEWSKFTSLFYQGFLFKIIIALIDTPLIYLCVYLIRTVFKININEELS